MEQPKLCFVIIINSKIKNGFDNTFTLKSNSSFLTGVDCSIELK